MSDAGVEDNARSLVCVPPEVPANFFLDLLGRERTLAPSALRTEKRRFAVLPKLPKHVWVRTTRSAVDAYEISSGTDNTEFEGNITCISQNALCPKECLRK